MKRVLAIAGLSIVLASRALPQAQNSDTVKTRPPEGGKVEALGSFSADLFTGRFSYSVPIAATPARGGVQPQVALGYSSSSGNGWCGVGWQMGVGAIERDAREGLPVLWSSVADPLTQYSVALSQYDDSKGFTLSYGGVSGRLVAMGGGEYRPKIEGSFSKLQYVKPHWVLTDRNGNKTYFGLTNNSRLENPNWTSTAPEDRTARWLVSASEDVHGNRIDYTYYWSANTAYLQRIDYGGNPAQSLAHTRSVIFQIEGRPDSIVDMRWGFRATTQFRLKEIDVVAGAQPVRSYRLDYEISPSTGKSRVKTIQQCSPAVDGQGNPICLPPLTLSYQDVDFTFADRQLWGPLLNESSSQDNTNWCSVTGERVEMGQNHPTWQKFLGFAATMSDVVDFDNDGLPDRVMRELNEPFSEFFVQFNRGDGFDPQLYSFPLTVTHSWSGMGSLGAMINICTDFSQSSCNDSYAAGQSSLIDLDGDGDLDRLLRPQFDPAATPYNYFHVHPGTGMGFAQLVKTLAPFQNLGQTSFGRNSFHGVGDDISQHGLTSVSMLDLDGDGKPDRVSLPLPSSPYDRFLVEKNISTPGDFDFLSQGGVSVMREWVGVQTQGASQGSGAKDWGGMSSVSQPGIFVQMLDMNGDGLLDRVSRERNTNTYPQGDPNDCDAFAVQLNNGLGFEPTEYWPIERQAGTNDERWSRPQGIADPIGTNWVGHAVSMLVDINGDGLPDRVLRKAATPFDRFRVQVNTGSGFLPLQDFLLGAIGDDTTDYWNAPMGRNANSDTFASLRDMDGDGLIDRVLRKDNAPLTDGLYIERNTGKLPDLLSQIDNGIGGKTNVTYRSSSQLNNRDQDLTGTPWAQSAKSLLPFAVQVVDTVQSDNGLGELLTTQYAFEHGRWDAVEREFRGFQKSTVTSPAGQKSVTYFHQGGGYDGAASGEYQDAGAHAKQGIPYRVEAYGNDNKLYQVSLSKVEEADLGNGRYFPFVSQTISMSYEGFTNYRATASASVYNTSTGDVTLATSYGEVTAVNVPSHSFSDIPGDTVYTLYEYTSVVGNSDIVSRPSKTTVSPSATGSPRLREAQSTYWALTGNLKESKQWVDTNDSYLTSSFTYDAYGNLWTSTDVAGTLTQFTYDTVEYAFLVNTDADPSGLHFVTQVTPDMRTGLPLTITDANGIVSRFEYDEFFRLKNTFNDYPAPDGASVWRERYSYNLGGIVGGLSLNYVHVQKNDAVDLVNGQEVRSYTDGLGRTLQARVESENAGQVRVAETRYDVHGRPYFENRAYWSNGFANTPLDTNRPGTLTTFDPMNRSLVVTPPAGDAGSPTGATTMQYGEPTSQDPWVTVKTNALGQKTASYRDAYGRTVKTIELVLNPCCGYYTTLFEYDLLGNLVKVTDPEKTVTLPGNVMQMSYDSLGRKYEMIDPDLGHWTYSYDAAGHLYEQIDAKGQKIRNTIYDALGRLKKKEVFKTGGQLEETILYTYDSSGGEPGYTVHKGELFQTQDGQGWEKSSYDARGREVKSTRYLSKTSASYTTKMSYTDADRLFELTYPGNLAKIKHSYDTAGHLTKIESTAGVTPVEIFYQSNGFTELDEPVGYTMGNGVATNYTYYQNSRRLQRMLTQKSAGVHQDLTYSYDEVGQVLSITDAVNTSGAATASLSGITYDDLGRLTQYTRNNTPFNFAYSKGGNLTLNEESGTGSYTYPAVGAARPHAATAANGKSYQYDANGQMTHRDAQLLHYDAQDRLVHVEGTNNVAFGYDASGVRLWREKGATRAIWIGGLYEERDGKTICHVMAEGKRICSFDPSLQRTTFPNLYPNGFFQYMSGDHLQSANVITNRAGNVVQRYQYAAFGKDIFTQDTAGVPASTRFTDQVFDADTGLYYYGARYYDPELGRFVQPDTIVPPVGGSQSLNRYAYTLNNPLNHTDPSGHSPLGGPEFVSMGNSVWWVQAGVGAWSLGQMPTMGAFGLQGPNTMPGRFTDGREVTVHLDRVGVGGSRRDRIGPPPEYSHGLVEMFDHFIAQWKSLPSSYGVIDKLIVSTRAMNFMGFTGEDALTRRELKRPYMERSMENLAKAIESGTPILGTGNLRVGGMGGAGFGGASIPFWISGKVPKSFGQAAIPMEEFWDAKILGPAPRPGSLVRFSITTKGQPVVDVVWANQSKTSVADVSLRIDQALRVDPSDSLASRFVTNPTEYKGAILSNFFTPQQLGIPGAGPDTKSLYFWVGQRGAVQTSFRDVLDHLLDRER